MANLATANLAALTDYGVVVADVTALSDARTDFAARKTGPRMASSEHKAQTDALPRKIASARSIFRNELDKMVTKFKHTHPDFYNSYLAVRVIVNRMGHASDKFFNTRHAGYAEPLAGGPGSTRSVTGEDCRKRRRGGRVARRRQRFAAQPSRQTHGSRCGALTFGRFAIVARPATVESQIAARFLVAPGITFGGSAISVASPSAASIVSHPAHDPDQ